MSFSSSRRQGRHTLEFQKLTLLLKTDRRRHSKMEGNILTFSIRNHTMVLKLINCSSRFASGVSGPGGYVAAIKAAQLGMK
uniref:Uncharacterized protein n=1 Tax=Romanomermis culicivorax TaxID=13658 RepID=A0A915JGX6_ROMCU